MIDGPSLPEFCAEMESLGAAIRASREMMPHCGATTNAGYHVLIGADGRYTLIYSERGVPDVMASSLVPEEVMEQVFIELTTNMAAIAVADDQPPLDAAEALRMSQLSDAELRDAAIDFHLRTSRIQEDLLGKLNTEWRDRRSAWNAQKLRETKQLFSEGSQD